MCSSPRITSRFRCRPRWGFSAGAPIGNSFTQDDLETNFSWRLTGLSLVTEFTYDTRGHTLTVTDPNGTVTEYVYDGLDRRISETRAGVLQREYEYDFNGNVTGAPVFANDGFINLGAGRTLTGAITTNTANTGTLTLNGGSSVTGAIGGANGLKQINVAGGNVALMANCPARAESSTTMPSFVCTESRKSGLHPDRCCRM